MSPKKYIDIQLHIVEEMKCNSFLSYDNICWWVVRSSTAGGGLDG